MNPQESRAAVRTALSEIAPEVDFEALNPDRSLREQAEIDSFDFINFLLRLQEMTGVEIPEADYEQIRTLNGLITYLH